MAILTISFTRGLLQLIYLLNLSRRGCYHTVRHTLDRVLSSFLIMHQFIRTLIYTSSIMMLVLYSNFYHYTH
jgi:hypothetical protein